MILFKVTDVPATHERLVEAGYDVVYGRRLYMEQGETVVTDDPDALAERDYYTLAYAEKADPSVDRATAKFGHSEERAEAAEHGDEVGPRGRRDGGALG